MPSGQILITFIETYAIGGLCIFVSSSFAGIYVVTLIVPVSYVEHLSILALWDILRKELLMIARARQIDEENRDSVWSRIDESLLRVEVRCRRGALGRRVIIWFVVQATAIEEDKAIGEPVCLILLLLGPCTDPLWVSYRY